jgi:mono/diheme cytochrome c family protein
MLKRLVLGIILTLLVGVLLILAGRQAGGRMTAAQAGQGGRAIEHGAAIFRDNCSGCHGLAGKGVEGVAPPLNSSDFFTARLREVNYPGSLRSYIEGVVSHGRTLPNEKYRAAMPPWSQAAGGPLREDEIHDVASFVLNWEAAALGRAPTPTPMPAVQTEAGTSNASAAVGMVVYRAHACLGCHGWPGRGGVTGPDLAGIATKGPEKMPGLTAEQYIRVSILAPSAFITPDCPPGPCPDMMPRNYGEELPQEELDALVRYLLTLR